MIKKSRELRLPAFFVRPGTLFIVYCIQIFTLSVPVCALKDFFSSTIFKFILYPFHVPWGTFSRLLYSNLYFIRSSVCLEAPILVYCIQILNFTDHYLTHFLSKIHFLSNLLSKFKFNRFTMSVETMTIVHYI